MCGIVGIVNIQDRAQINRDLLERMNNLQAHRGPDDGRVHIEPGVGLGHRRLSIIDLSSGQQPLYNEDGSVVVVYNGEIYNHKVLKQELEHCGHTFRTQCDTEVIVHAWEEWGQDCVERFNGMFSFGLWDRNRSVLFLARDRLGIKPLYYAVLTGRQVIFASELKALLLHPELQRRLDSFAVEEYFAFGYIPEPKTILRDVSKLRPAHTLMFKRGEKPGTQNEYWDVPFDRGSIDKIEAAQGELVERLRESVRMRLMSDVPLGAFLSGGVDSSAVVAMMAGLSESKVNTCSISFGDPRYNEAQFAQKVAKQYSTNHHVEEVQSDDFDLIDILASIYDEPFADSSAMPTYRVCQLARKYVTVALSGDGGDEIFAGYRRYRWHVYEQRVRSMLPQTLRGPLFGLLGKIYPKLDWAPRILRAKSTLQSLARDTLEGYFHSVSIVPDYLRERLFSAGFARELQGYSAVEVLRRHAARAPSEHPLSRIQYLDLKTYLPGDILTKVDRASMAHSLEVRVPILDHTLVEWVSGLPPEWKLSGREGKWLFKRSLKRYLPDDILYRSKMGFAVPLASWFRGPLRDRVRRAVLGDTLMDTGFFDRRFLEKLVDRHQSGVGEHSAVLWSLLMFEAFLRNVRLEGEGDATVAGPALAEGSRKPASSPA